MVVLTHNLLASAQRAYLGLGIGVVFGLAFALIAGLTRSGEAVVDGLVQIKRAIATFALIPLGILWLGIGEAMKVALIATSVFIPVYINTHAGLRGIDLRYVELARTVGLGPADFLRLVAIPGALPGFFTGLRLAVNTCWTSLVVLEQINTTSGIGYLMSRARDYGQTDVMVVGLAVYAILGLVSDTVVRLLERKALVYRKVLGRDGAPPQPDQRIFRAKRAGRRRTGSPTGPIRGADRSEWFRQEHVAARHRRA